MNDYSMYYSNVVLYSPVNSEKKLKQFCSFHTGHFLDVLSTEWKRSNGHGYDCGRDTYFSS